MSAELGRQPGTAVGCRSPRRPPGEAKRGAAGAFRVPWARCIGLAADAASGRGRLRAGRRRGRRARQDGARPPLQRRRAGGHAGVSGACDSLSLPRPLGPLVDMAPLLARLRASPDPIEDATRTQLFSTLRDCPRGASTHVLVFEDMHWADDATLDLLRYLGRRLDSNAQPAGGLPTARRRGGAPPSAAGGARRPGHLGRRCDG